MTKVAHPLRFALALLTAVAIPMPLLAQSDCHVDELSRDDDGGQRRLAVRGDTGWQFFRPSADALTHVGACRNRLGRPSLRYGAATNGSGKSAAHVVDTVHDPCPVQTGQAPCRGFLQWRS